MTLSNKHPFHQFNYCPKCGSDKFKIVNEKAKHCDNCNFTYYFNSCASTVGMIYNAQGELLVATRAKDPAQGTYDLPGGFVDMFETAEEAVTREIKEETNLNVIDLKYLFSIPNIYLYSGFEVHTVDMVFECKVDDFTNLKAADDVTKLDFIKKEDLDADKFGLTSIKEIIRRIQK